MKNASKKIQSYIKLQIGAGKANPSPPVGPALGQHGVNIMEFCKAFNAQTQNFDAGTPVSVVITVYADRTFSFILKTPPTSFLLRKALNITKGSSTPNTKKVGVVNKEQLLEIAKIKMPDLNVNGVYEAMKTVAGTALSSGITVDWDYVNDIDES